MRKIKTGILLAVLLFSAACFMSPRVHLAAQEFRGRTFNEVWDASLWAIRDMNLTVISMNRRGGMIGADPAGYPYHHYPPLLSVLIRGNSRAVFVECRISQMDRRGEAVGFGRRNVREFFTALNYHLGRIR
jgi:hypothetical protein